MRILHFVNTFGATTTTFIFNQVRWLQQDHEVLVVCTRRENEAEFSFDPLEVVAYSPNIWRARVHRRLRRFNIYLDYHEPNFSQALNKTIFDFDPEIIHCQFGTDALYLIDNLKYRKNSIPIFIQFRGYDASQMLHSSNVYTRRMQALTKRKNIHPIFVADFLYKNVKKHGIFPDKRRILYSCTNLVFFQRKQYPAKKGSHIFLQVSSFKEKKGHFFTLQAFHLLKTRYPEIPWRLILGGDGPLLQQTIELSKTLSLTDNVEFPGRLTPIQIREFLENAHYFVHHSLTDRNGSTEGIPNAIMEAMAMELPIVSTWHAGIPELVEDGINGYLVPEQDIDTYCERLSNITKWGFLPRNRKKIADNFEINLHKSTLIEYYQEVLS